MFWVKLSVFEYLWSLFPFLPPLFSFALLMYPVLVIMNLIIYSTDNLALVKTSCVWLMALFGVILKFSGIYFSCIYLVMVANVKHTAFLKLAIVTMNHLNPLLHVPYLEAGIQKQNISELSHL